ncbi:PAN domain-containing protein [Rhizobium leguminosarum]|uniref:PAN domain-containing protein n=1 Tax=Rhizobium leguminosarum TaxID=384 RepID=UPI003F99F732
MRQSAERAVRVWLWKAKALMLPFAILSIVSASVTPATAQTAQSDAPLISYPATTLTGMQSAELRKSLEDCRKICRDRPGCVGFDHTPSSNQCRLFAAINSARDNAETTAETKYPINGYRTPAAQQEPTPEEPKQRQFALFPNHDVFGNDIDVFPSDSLALCQQACADNAQCSVFTFNAWNTKCFLKAGAGELRLDPRATTGVSSELGPPSYRDSQVKIEYYHSYVMSGSRIGPRRLSNSRQQCENICWENDSCVAFSFAAGDRACSIYDSADNRFPQQGIESGSKVQPRP